MANLVVTSTTNAIKVVFNNYSSASNIKKGTWRKNNIVKFSLSNDGTYIHALIKEDNNWKVSFDGVGNTFLIDSVDGVVPTNNENLQDLLSVLIE